MTTATLTELVAVVILAGLAIGGYCGRVENYGTPIGQNAGLHAEIVAGV